MRTQLRSALVGSAAAIALLAVPGAASASQGTHIEPGPTSAVAMGVMPPGMHVMMNAPGHENFMASPGHEHVMSSPGHQAMMG